jgi:hypothetical protein
MVAGESIDRAAIRAMVEDFWRSFLAVVRQNQQISRETILRFEERIRAMAALMSPEQSEVFLQTADEEREILYNEYWRSPEALKHRLGLVSNLQQPVAIHQQQGLGGTIVKTAVRATVWESVFALFRLFR